MASLYKISNDILSIFNDIESNDGEITNDQYDELCIKQEELKEKLNSYVKAVKEFQSDADFCKKEKQAINNRQNIYKNRVERLKKAMLDAVLQFGEHGKNNMFVELPTCRIFSKASKSIEVDEYRMSVFMAEFERYIRELVNTGVLYTGYDVDMQGILDSINANCKAITNEDFEPFTMNDLLNIKITISQTTTIDEFFKRGTALEMYGKESTYSTMEECTSKDEWAGAIEHAKTCNHPLPTVVKQVVNQSLQIK